MDCAIYVRAFKESSIEGLLKSLDIFERSDAIESNDFTRDMIALITLELNIRSSYPP